MATFINAIELAVAAPQKLYMYYYQIYPKYNTPLVGIGSDIHVSDSTYFDQTRANGRVNTIQT